MERNDLEQYKKAAQKIGVAQQSNTWAQAAVGNGAGGVWIAPSSGTVTSYAANTLTTTR